MKKLRIMHVLYSLDIGGSETVGSEIAKYMQSNGHSNMVVALEHDGVLSAELRALGIETRAVNRAGKGMFEAMKDVWDIISEFKPEVIHTHHMYTLFYTVAGAFRFRVPIVHTEHEFWTLDTRNGKLYMPFLGRFCGAITAVNDSTRDFMRDSLKLQPRKLVTVLNGIDLKRYNARTSLARSDIGLKDSDKVAGIVARLDKVKNHEMLIRAWTIVVKEAPEAMLVVVGEGEEEKFLKGLVKELNLDGRVVFLGPRRDVSDILPLLDVAVLSSREEGLPMTLLEAMASELPVVATAVGGVPQLVKDGSNGLLCESGDESGMAAAIVEIFNSGKNAREMGMAGLRLVREKYSLDSSAGYYESMYLNLVETGSWT